MIFSKEEELFPTVNSSDISATEDVNVKDEAGEGNQNGKRKLSDKEATKKVCCFCRFIYYLRIYFLVCSVSIFSFFSSEY